MKRILISTIAIAALIAGCGSGGSTTKAAHKTKTSTTSTSKTTTTKHRHHKKIVVKKTKKVVHRSTTSTSGGAAVTTTAVTTTAATTTSTPPPPPPPPATTTHSAPPPVTTHQAPPPKHHHHHGGGQPQGYCLSVSDRIATPTGSVSVAQITPGMQVWSTDAQGRRIAVDVLEVHHTAVPATHLMVKLHLADGRVVLASLGHPLPDGQPISTLSVGQQFEGTRVVSDTRVVYGKPYTYDLLPAGPTHTYYADGILLGSTLAPVQLSRPF